MQTFKEQVTKLNPELREFLNKNQEDYFIVEGTTKITEHIAWKCSEYRPCKRTTCDSCLERRRRYFVKMGTLLAKEKGLNKHATITWPLLHGIDPWPSMSSLSAMMSKNLTGRVGPFMRALALGNAGTPHVHYLINSKFEDRFYKLAKKHSPHLSRVFLDVKEAYDIPQLLNYLFVQNFIPTVNDPRRTKGIRLLSGSRGYNFTYSYPTAKHWKHYIELVAQDEQFV